MIIVLRPDASEEQIDHLLSRIREMGLTPHISRGIERTIVGVIGDERLIRERSFQSTPGVEHVMSILKPFKLASREFKHDDTIVHVNKVEFGGNKIVLIAGPCSIENPEQLMKTANAVKAAGATVLRGGAFKPRTSPYSFQGLGEEGLKLLDEARRATGLSVVSEVMDTRDVELVARYVDILQIGTHNQHNYALLKEVGTLQKPVILKRGLSSTVEEYLLAAEYILSRGNNQVILCERGIRTFEKATRNTLDISAIPVLKHLSHLPVIVDPSQATGNWRLVEPMSMASVAAGADGLMIEVHPEPEKALSDGAQSLLPEKYAHLVSQVQLIARAIGREI